MPGWSEQLQTPRVLTRVRKRAYVIKEKYIKEKDIRMGVISNGPLHSPLNVYQSMNCQLL